LANLEIGLRQKWFLSASEVVLVRVRSGSYPEEWLATDLTSGQNGQRLRHQDGRCCSSGSWSGSGSSRPSAA